MFVDPFSLHAGWMRIECGEEYERRRGSVFCGI